MQLDQTVKVGDLLTSFSVIVAAATFGYSWWKDRIVRQRDQAAHVRAAAGEALAKLELWVELTLSLTGNVQELLVETSQMLSTSHDVGLARDYLWKGLNRARGDIVTRQREAGIGPAYIQLYAYRPDAYRNFVDIFSSLRTTVDQQFTLLLDGTQHLVLTSEPESESYDPANLGNHLREAVHKSEAGLRTAMESVLARARNELGGIIEAGDRAVLR